MHYIIGLLATAAALAYWFNRASKGANEIADAANTLQNLPRKMRYRQKAGKRGLDLIEEPIEAATVLMIATARSDGAGRVSDAQSKAISRQLQSHMHLSQSDADDMVLQLRSLTQYLTQPDSALYPMVDILQSAVSREDARDLSAMLNHIADIDEPANADQLSLIRRFEERMGLQN